MKKSQKSNASIGLVRTNAKQFFKSKSFYISVFIILLIMALTLLAETTSSKIDIVIGDGIGYNFFKLFYFGILPKLIILVATLPVVTGFCTDWNTRYIRSVAGRAGVAKYARHKVYMGIAATFFTCFIALSLFTLILLTFMPIATESGTEALIRLYPFGSIAGTHPYLCQLIRIICFSSFCTVWSVLGLAISAYIPNRYIVYASPFIIYYIFEQVINNKITQAVPTFLYLPYLGTISLTSPLFGNIVIDFLYINLLFIGLALLIGELFIHGVKRRMRNEIV